MESMFVAQVVDEKWKYKKQDINRDDKHTDNRESETASQHGVIKNRRQKPMVSKLSLPYLCYFIYLFSLLLK